jgi:hypothetical protein
MKALIACLACAALASGCTSTSSNSCTEDVAVALAELVGIPTSDRYEVHCGERTDSAK